MKLGAKSFFLTLVSGIALVAACTGSSPVGIGGGLVGIGNETCTPGPACGATVLQACRTADPSGRCTSVSYRVDRLSFACASCSDCQKAVRDATASCTGAGPGNPSGPGGETCVPATACATDLVQACTTRDGAGTCVGVTYKSGGQSFACASCTDCGEAMTLASGACGPGRPPKDAGVQKDAGGACVSRCQSDSECQNSCPAAPVGGANCCDPTVSVCYAASRSSCPAPAVDSGPPPPPPY